MKRIFPLLFLAAAACGPANQSDRSQQGGRNSSSGSSRTLFVQSTRSIVPGPQAFPPRTATFSASGEDGYSPLIQLPDGTIENAPQAPPDTRPAPKAKPLHFAALTVT